MATRDWRRRCEQRTHTADADDHAARSARGDAGSTTARRAGWPQLGAAVRAALLFRHRHRQLRGAAVVCQITTDTSTPRRRSQRSHDNFYGGREGTHHETKHGEFSRGRRVAAKAPRGMAAQRGWAAGRAKCRHGATRQRQGRQGRKEHRCAQEETRQEQAAPRVGGSRPATA